MKGAGVSSQGGESRIPELEAEIKRLRTKLNRYVPGLERLLRNRGFSVFRVGGRAGELLLPQESRFLGPYLRALDKYSFRLFLRDVIGNRDNVPPGRSTRFITPEVYEKYVTDLKRWGILKPGKNRLRLSPSVRSFGPTLEWWVARILHRRLGYESLQGVRFRGRLPGGDYDVLARVEDRIVYIEIKSSPPKQVMDSELDAFLARVRDLEPSAACFFMDTELRMTDKILPMFKAAMKRREGMYHGSFERLDRELFGLGNRLYILNARGGVRENLARVIADHLKLCDR